MIDPVEKDVGRSVCYVPPGSPCRAEFGIITTITERYVFVRYDGEDAAKATRREDLFWSTRSAGM